MRLVAWILVPALILASCATGHFVSGFDLEQFRALEPGKTTKTDVLTLAGPPVVRTKTPDGEAWAYATTEARSTALILPFYARVQSTAPQTKTAVLIFRGELLDRIEWKP